MGKLKDMYLYYDRVRFCCCINSEQWYSDDRNTILEQTIIINRLLEKPYHIGVNEEDAFVAFYRRYKAWISAKFIDEWYLFGERYTDCFLPKNRKSWNTYDFKSIFDVNTYSTLFFAQTFCVFANLQLKLWESRFDDPQPENNELLVAHKMYYGTLLMLKLIGYRLDEDVKKEKSVLDALLAKVYSYDYTDTQGETP